MLDVGPFAVQYWSGIAAGTSQLPLVRVSFAPDVFAILPIA
jgi:hypothetical protein